MEKKNKLYELPWPEIREAAKRERLDPYLIASIILIESSGNRFALKAEPGYQWISNESDARTYADLLGSSLDTELIGQKISWGLMQVMGGTSRWLGFRDWFPKLCETNTGIKYGTLYLRKKADQYKTIEEIISAYNAGSVQYTKSGMFKNQTYVDTVMQHYRDIENLGGKLN